MTTYEPRRDDSHSVLCALVADQRLLIEELRRAALEVVPLLAPGAHLERIRGALERSSDYAPRALLDKAGSIKPAVAL